jgi:hypothetical protein
VVRTTGAIGHHAVIAAFINLSKEQLRFSSFIATESERDEILPFHEEMIALVLA